MTDSEIVEAARRYPSVEEIAGLLRAHQFAKFAPRDQAHGFVCKAKCVEVGFPERCTGSDMEAHHQASVIVAMWEELQ